MSKIEIIFNSVYDVGVHEDLQDSDLSTKVSNIITAMKEIRITAHKFVECLEHNGKIYRIIYNP